MRVCAEPSSMMPVRSRLGCYKSSPSAHVAVKPAYKSSVVLVDMYALQRTSDRGERCDWDDGQHMQSG